MSRPWLVSVAVCPRRSCWIRFTPLQGTSIPRLIWGQSGMAIATWAAAAILGRCCRLAGGLRNSYTDKLTDRTQLQGCSMNNSQQHLVNPEIMGMAIMALAEDFGSIKQAFVPAGD